MAQTVKLKRSAVSGNIPTTSDLALGEIAINTYDGTIFIKKNDGTETIVTFSPGSNAGSIEENSFSGDGSTTGFTLSTAPSSEENLLVFIDATFQNRDSFTISGTTITFDTAPDSGSSVRVYNVIPGSVDDGILTVAKFAANTLVLESEGIASNDNDNTIPTSAAVKDYVDTQVATVDTLPEVLANGNTTGGTDISVSTGDDITFADSSKAIFGAGSDLQIYHDGTRSIINDAGTGDLQFQIGGSAIFDVTTDGIAMEGFPESSYEIRGDLDGGIRFTVQAGEALSKGDVVYISGAAGDNTVVSKAQANSASTMPAFGLVLADIANGGSGQVVTFGNLYGSGGAALDTSTYSIGDSLYVSATTAGAFTNTAPTGESNLVQNIGKVLRSNSNNGVIKVGGAGRTNATPNLDQDQFFLGNASNQAVATDFSDAVEALSINNVVEDTTPQLGGDLASNGNDILFADNDKAIFGAGSDLQIYHDGSNSRLVDSGTGNFIIQAGQFRVNTADDSEAMIKADVDGAVTLYNNGSQKIATTSTGIDVTGTATMDGLTVDGTATISASTATLNISGSNTGASLINLGDSDDGNVGRIYYDHTSNFMQFKAADGERLRINSTGIDVTGTAAMDGLTVVGETTSSNGTYGTKLTYSNGNQSGIIDTFGNHNLEFRANNDRAMNIAANGDISFYEDTGTTAKLFWDASAESLGIGDIPSSIDGVLAIRSDSDSHAITIYEPVGANENWQLGVDADGDLGFYNSGSTTASVTFHDSGNVGIGTDSPAGALHLRDTIPHLYIQSDDGQSSKLLFGDATDNSRGGFEYTSSDAMIFMTNNLSEKMRIDSSGNVGIGTSSPTKTLHIYHATTNRPALVESGDAYSLIEFKDNSTTNAPAVGATGNNIIVQTGSSASERLRIDSSGNVLVGTTDTTPFDNSANSSSDNGIALRSDGILAVAAYKSTANSGNVVTANRTGTDGTIIGLQKSGTTVGSIGVASSELYIGSTTGNDAFFKFGYGAISPSTSAGANSDNYIDLGKATSRFKDLYLSGTISSGAITSTGEVEATALDINGNGDISGNLTLGGYLAGPATFTIDPAAVGDNTGTVVIAGNLQVDGTTTTINSTTLTVDDKNITLASGSANAAAANGAGLTVDGASATITYDGTNDEWDFNKNVKVAGSLGVTNIVTNKVVKYNGTILDDSNITDDGSTITLGSATTISGTTSINGITSVNIGSASTSFGNHQTALRIDNTNTTTNNWAALVFDSNDSPVAEVSARITDHANNYGDLYFANRSSAGYTTKMFIKQDGNVGIGTTSPTQKLHVSGSGSTVAIKIDNTGTGGDAWRIWSTNDVASDGGGKLGFYNEDTATRAMTLDSSGNVGIGTSSPSDFAANANNLVVGSGSGTEGITINSGTANYGVIYFADGTSGSAAYAGSINYNHADNSMRLGTNGSTTDVVIDSSGNVGIGTSSPSSLLNIKGADANLIIQDTNTGYSSQIASLTLTGSTASGAPRTDVQHKIKLNGDNLTFTNGTNDDERMRIQKNGNVGIGETAPAAKLQVEEYGIDTTETSTTATTQVAIHTFAAATFRSARFTVQVTNSTDSTYHLTEILMIHDGTTPSITEYGTIFTGSAEATFDADISSGNVRLLATPATTDSMAFKVVAHTITT